MGSESALCGKGKERDKVQVGQKMTVRDHKQIREGMQKAGHINLAL